MQRNSVNAMFGMFMAGPSGLGVMHSLLECRTPDCVDSAIYEVFVKIKNYETKIFRCNLIRLVLDQTQPKTDFLEVAIQPPEDIAKS